MELNKRNDLSRARSNASSSEADLPSPESALSGRANLHPERTLFSKFRFLFRHLWIIGLSVIVGLFVSIGYLIKTVPIYRSTVIFQVAQQQERNFTPTAAAATSGDDLRDDSVLNTLTESFKLDSLYLRVANDPAVLADPDIVPTDPASRQPPASLASQIKHETSVNLRKGTRLVDLSVENTSPRVAQVLATAVIEQFIAASGESDISTSTAKSKFLLDEVDHIKQSLQKSEEGLQVYKEALRQKSRVDDQQKVIDTLTQRYLDAHPKLIEARSLIADIKRAFDIEIKKVIATSPTEAAYWAQNQAGQPAQSPDDVISSELKMVEARTNVLQNEVNADSALFDNLLKQMREQDVQTAAAPVEIKVVDTATLPTHPIRPDPPTIIRNGILGGLLFGVAIVAGLLRLDSTFGSAEEVEQVTDLPVVAIIPLLPRSAASKRRKSKAASNVPTGPDGEPLDDLVLVTDPSGVVAENIRNLWASLELIGREEDRRTILFSSALPGEGKTFTSCNYAVSLAQHGSKTLLIDADLRRPSVYTRFRLKNNQPGFTEHVAKGLKLSEVVHKEVVENLDVMLTGGKCPNPAEFLGGKGFVETLQRALLSYDRVVVDSPPLIPVGDTRLLAPHVQNICLVVKAESTSRHALTRSINFLEKVHARPIGIIYNCVPAWSIDEYHGYSYTGKYKYGEAYGDKS